MLLRINISINSAIILILYGGKEGYELFYGTTSVADGIFFVGIHLGKGAAVGFVGAENRVVAKAALAVLFGENVSFHTPIKKVQFAFINKGYSRAEASCAPLRRHPLQLGKHLAHIGFAIVSLAGIARAIHTRFAAQRINFKTRVIAKAIVAVMLLNEARLLLGITLDGGARFGNIVVATDIVQTQNPKLLAHNLAQFLQFMSIIRSKNQSIHQQKIESKKPIIFKINLKI